MLLSLTAILLLLWLLGMVTSYTFGGYIHILLGLAILAIVARLFRGEDPY